MSRLPTLLVAIAAPAVLGAAWVAVQRAWRHSFPRAFADPDVLAERRGCSGCERVSECALEPAHSKCPSAEDES